MNKIKCFACGRTIKGAVYFADTAEDQKNLPVGPDCYLHIVEQAEYAKGQRIENPGYLPRSGGPFLFPGSKKALELYKLGSVR